MDKENRLHDIFELSMMILLRLVTVVFVALSLNLSPQFCGNAHAANQQVFDRLRTHTPGINIDLGFSLWWRNPECGRTDFFFPSEASVGGIDLSAADRDFVKHVNYLFPTEVELNRLVELGIRSIRFGVEGQYIFVPNCSKGSYINKFVLNRVKNTIERILDYQYSGPNTSLRGKRLQATVTINFVVDGGAQIKVPVDSENYPLTQGVSPRFRLHFQSELESNHDQLMDKYCDFWKELAGELRKYSPTRLLIEPFNEPIYLHTSKQWNLDQKRLIHTIRSAAPNHTLIVTSSAFSSPWRLVSQTDLVDDNNVIYNFHFYEDPKICQEGLYSYPLQVGPPACPTFNRDRIQKKWMNPVSDWQSRNDVVVLANEFGCVAYKKALDSRGQKVPIPMQTRINWTHDVRQLLDLHSIPWFVFEYAGAYPVFDGDLQAPQRWQKVGTKCNPPTWLRPTPHEIPGMVWALGMPRK